MQYLANITAAKGSEISIRLFDPAASKWWTGLSWTALEASALLVPLTVVVLADVDEDRYVGTLTLPTGGPFLAEYLDASAAVIGEELTEGVPVTGDSNGLLVTLTRGKVKDDSDKLSDPDDLVSACAEALNRYSKARPHEVVADIPGAGTHDCALPDNWLEGFSSIIQVEYPVDRVPAVILDRRDYSVYATPAGKKLRILIATPDTDENVRQTYTVLHSEDSVPAVDLEAVANLAASFCCLILAAKYGNTSDPTIQADVVNYRSKIDEYRRLAQHYEGLYKTHLGIKNDDTVAASMVTASPPDSRRTRLISGRR